MNYHWNWRIFWEPAPNGTGNYLDMLLSGLVLTIETAICAWIIALVIGSIVGVHAHAAVEDRILVRLLLRRILPQHAVAGAAVPLVLRAAGTPAAQPGLWLKQMPNAPF